MAVYPHVSIDVYNYNREKVVNLYDSALDSPGQAYDIVHVNEINGWQELTFVMPYVMNEEYNHRWDYIKAEYKVCLTIGNVREWFYIQQPKAKRDSKAINNTVKCTAECGILKTKNIYAEFDDENGIGTLAELATKVLTGTGWSLGYYDIPLEEDGVTEKVRSLKSSGKAGAYKLITTLCDLFKMYPVFDSDAHTVNFYGLANRDIHREFMVGGASKERADVVGGGSLVGVGIIGIMIVGYDSTGAFLHDGDEVSSAYGVTALTVEKDSSKIITRMYVEGEYAEDGYVGIDSVNPTGLTYIMNFDYYKDIGLFTAEHEAALEEYETAMTSIVHDIREYSAWIALKSNELNTLWGQWKFVEYVVENSVIVKHILGGEAEEEDATIEEGDLLLIVGKDNDEYTYRTVTAGNGGSVSFQSTDEYAIKYILANPQEQEETWFEPKYFKPAGIIGFKEVSIEAKEAANTDLDRQIAIVDAAIDQWRREHPTEPVPQSFTQERQRYVDQKNANLAEIQEIYDGNPGTAEGSTATVGLKQLTYEAMKMCADLDDYHITLENLVEEQEQVENDFVAEMGDFLKDGYWSNTNYILGQEEALYADALEVLASMSQPSVKYTIQRANLSANLGYKVEDFRINSQIRLYDPFIGVNDLVYIKKITKHLDAPWKDTVEIANEKDITISGQSLDSTLSRITSLASSLDERQAMYERAKAIGSNGTFSAEKFEGLISTMQNKINSAISGWYTDDAGNIMFISADGQRAMKLTGEGWAIAPNKNEDGEWNWRTAADGRGIVADTITTGFLSADRILANSITAEKLSNGVGASIDLSGNSVIISVGNKADAATATANAASQTANSASQTANSASQTANSASQTANAASQAATSATQTANAASTAASNAQSTADAANTAASNAQATASGAQTTANSARDTATAAQTTATNAQTAADNAQSAADTAQATAEAAQESVDNMEIGGRNLLLNTLRSTIEPDGSSIRTQSGMIIAGSAATSSSYQVYAEGVPHGIGMQSKKGFRPYVAFGFLNPANCDMLGLTPGETYTWSGDVRYKVLSSSTVDYDCLMFSALYSNFSTLTASRNVANLANQYKSLDTITPEEHGVEKSCRMEFTFTVPDDSTVLRLEVICSRTAANNYANGDFIEISNMKLEKGDKATDWTAAPEDYEGDISQAQQTADAAHSMAETAQSNLEVYKTESSSTFSQMQDAIEARVTTTEYDANNAAIGERISVVEVRTGSVETKVQNLEKGIGTHFIVEENMVRITQDQDQNWEQQLTASDMSFVNKSTGEVSASFGIQGGYADRLRSNKELSVGTTTDGWYDMVALQTGVADKWRNGDTAAVVVPLIIEEPVNCYVDLTESTPQISFTVTAENTPTYQWYYKLKSEDDTQWRVVAGANGYQYVTSYGATMQTYEYRCKLTGNDGSTAYTRACCVYVIGNPEILGQPTPETTVNVGEVATVSIVATGATSYTWQHSENGSWVNDVTTTSPTRSTAELAAMTKTYRCMVNNSVGSIPSESYTITWE